MNRGGLKQNGQEEENGDHISGDAIADPKFGDETIGVDCILLSTLFSTIVRKCSATDIELETDCTYSNDDCENRKKKHV